MDPAATSTAPAPAVAAGVAADCFAVGADGFLWLWAFLFVLRGGTIGFEHAAARRDVVPFTFAADCCTPRHTR